MVNAKTIRVKMHILYIVSEIINVFEHDILTLLLV